MAAIYTIIMSRRGGPDCYYIGQSVNPKERWQQHIRALRAGRHDNQRLQRSFAKYGETALRFQIIAHVDGDAETLCVHEQMALDFFIACCGERRIINAMRDCVTSHLGVKRSAVTRERMSVAQMGRKCSAEHVEKNRTARLGSHHTDETKRLLSEKAKGRPPHPNSLIALSVARRSGARLEGLRAALRGRPKIHSEETKRRIALSLTGRKQSLELIAKRVAGMAAARARRSSDG